MEYVSVMEAGARWGVSDRQVQRLAAAGRIPGALKFGASWQIPTAAEKPADPRKERKGSQGDKPALIFLTAETLPKEPGRAAPAVFHPLVEADNAFRRGDCEPAKALWQSVGRSDETLLSASSLATAAAISSGDYALYYEIQEFLQSRSALCENERDKALLSLPGALAAVSMALPSLTPEWLKSCDFSLFPYELRPFLLYLYTLHLRNVGDHAAMLATANTVLTMCERPDTFTWIDVYLGVLCAEAAYALGRLALSKQYLSAALALAMPWGFLAPFADHLGEFGGAMETEIERQYPAYRKPLLALWNSSFKNWMGFRNRFAAENITTVLSPQEYHAAHLISRGATYAETARRMNLSLGRIKGILAEVYSKLYIQKQSELKQFII